MHDFLKMEKPCHCKAAGRGALSAQREEVPLGCNPFSFSGETDSHGRFAPSE